MQNDENVENFKPSVVEVSDEDESEDEKYYNNKVFERKVCNIEYDTSEITGSSNSVCQEAIVEVESDDESVGSGNASTNLEFSWLKYEASTTKENETEKLKRLIAEEEASEAPATNELSENSIMIEEEQDTDEGVIDVKSETIKNKREASPINLDRSVEKISPEMVFTSDSEAESLKGEIIEIESDEDELSDMGSNKSMARASFSAMFSQSSNDSNECIEVKEDDEDINTAKEDKSLVIIEDDSQVEEHVKLSDAEAEWANTAEQKETFVNVSSSNTKTKTSMEEVEGDDKATEVKPLGPTEEIVSDNEEEDQELYGEETELDLEADYFSPNLNMKKINSTRVTASYSYDTVTSAVDNERSITSKIKVETLLSDDIVTMPESVKKSTENKSEDLMDVVPSASQEVTPIRNDEFDEKDDMRELLANVSTTATRASSIAGSILGEIKQSSIDSEFSAASFSFTAPKKLGQCEVHEDNNRSNLNFSFSSPLDSSYVNEISETEEEKKESNVNYSWCKAPSKPKVDVMNLIQEEIDQSSRIISVPKEAEHTVIEEDQQTRESVKGFDDKCEQSTTSIGAEESDLDTEEEIEESNVNYSWCQVPSKPKVDVMQLIQEEIALSSRISVSKEAEYSVIEEDQQSRETDKDSVQRAEQSTTSSKPEDSDLDTEEENEESNVNY